MIMINIPMPNNCLECPIHDGEYGYCNVNKNIIINIDERPRRCPIIEENKNNHSQSEFSKEFVKFIKTHKISVQTDPSGNVNVSAIKHENGHWINARCDDGYWIADCDQCGATIQWYEPDDKPRYCCMCGSDNREV